MNARATSRPIPLAPAVTSTRSPLMPSSTGPSQVFAGLCPPLGRPYVLGKSTASVMGGLPARHCRRTAREGYRMGFTLSRRTLMQGAAGSALLAGVGAPALVRAQADAIRIGHLTPL